jgi:hypothetical protein
VEEKMKKIMIAGVVVFILVGVIATYLLFFIEDDSGIALPLYIDQIDKTETSVTIRIEKMNYPETWSINETTLGFSKNNGMVAELISATVFHENGTLAARYTPDSDWTLHYYGTPDALEFKAGMIVIISAPSINVGDSIVIGSKYHYGLVTFTVS